MAYGVVINGVNFTSLIGDEALMRQAQLLSKSLDDASLSKHVVSIDMGSATTHISTSSERAKIMEIAKEIISSDITCD